MGDYSPILQESHMSDTATVSKELTTVKIKEPGKFKVIFLNDDVTPMALVIALLMTVFKHDSDAAHELTMRIHNEGQAVVGTYVFEIAEQKSVEATTIARNNNAPLIIKLQEE